MGIASLLSTYYYALGKCLESEIVLRRLNIGHVH